MTVGSGGCSIAKMDATHITIISGISDVTITNIFLSTYRALTTEIMGRGSSGSYERITIYAKGIKKGIFYGSKVDATRQSSLSYFEHTLTQSFTPILATNLTPNDKYHVRLFCSYNSTMDIQAYEGNYTVDANGTLEVTLPEGTILTTNEESSRLRSTWPTDTHDIIPIYP